MVFVSGGSLEITTMNKIFLLSLLVLLMSCEETELLTEIQTIKYGTSFGMCAGYCLTDLSVSTSEAVVVAYGWNNSVTPKQQAIPFSQLQLENILLKIDPQVFESLDPVIGCPDCADGGAEWIELTLNGRTKRVTFEYGATIAGIDGTVADLRALTNQIRPE